MGILKKPYKDITGLQDRFVELYGEKTVAQIERYNKVFCEYKNYFNLQEAYVASSSGRVEVCGNHTDHNGGNVISCAISLDALAFFMPTDDGVIRIKSDGYDQMVIDTNAPVTEKIGTSSALVRGVVVGLLDRGYKTGGFCAYVSSNVLGGAGISSSASFELLICEILNFLYNDGKIDEEQKAIIAQYSENKFFGKPCGLLDQTAISFGGLKKLDFSNKTKISVSNIDNDLSDYSLVLINTGGSHANLTSEYASIPQEMKQIANVFGKDRLIEITEEDFYSKLPQFIDKVSDRAICRAVHFYNENKRVEQVVESLSKNDFASFLDAVNNSGLSSLWLLQNCYVSGSKDQLIPKALAISKKFLHNGANRVHGGGFAGTILNIVKNDCLADFIQNISKYYPLDAIIPLKVRSVGTIVL